MKGGMRERKTENNERKREKRKNGNDEREEV